MGILTRMQASTLANPDGMLIDAFGGMPSKSGQRVNNETAMRVSTVFACVRILAESIAQLPLMLYRVAEDGSKTRAVDHPLYWLLHNQPNGWQTSFEFREQLMWHAALRGNGYAYINRAGGRILELLPLDPDRVTVTQAQDFTLAYKVTRTGNREPLVFGSRDVLHLRGPSLDGIVGLSLVGYARETIALAMATEEHGSRFFANAMRPSGVLSRPAEKKALEEKSARRLLESFTQATSGPNAQRAVLLEEGMTWTSSMSMKNDDMQFLETRKYQKEEICAIFRVPPHLVADLERATFSNIEQQSTEFVIYSIGPWMGRWEGAIERDLIAERAQGNLVAEFLVEGLLRGDTASRYSAYSSGITSGWLTRNEARRRENLNPLPGLDEPLTPVAVAQKDSSNSGTTDGGDAPEKTGDQNASDRAAALQASTVRAMEAMQVTAERTASASTAASHRATTALAAIASRAPEPTTVTIAEGAVQVTVENTQPARTTRPKGFRREDDGTVSVLYEEVA